MKIGAILRNHALSSFRRYFLVSTLITMIRQHKHALAEKFEQKHCICKGKSSEIPSVLTEDVVEDIERRIEQSPKKSVAKLAAQTGLSVGTCHKALTKALHMHPYKVSVVQQLHGPDDNRRQKDTVLPMVQSDFHSR